MTATLEIARNTAAEKAEWISISAAAHVLGRSGMQVRRYVETGALEAKRIGSRGWIQVKREDVLRKLRSFDKVEAE